MGLQVKCVYKKILVLNNTNRNSSRLMRGLGTEEDSTVRLPFVPNHGEARVAGNKENFSDPR